MQSVNSHQTIAIFRHILVYEHSGQKFSWISKFKVNMNFLEITNYFWNVYVTLMLHPEKVKAALMEHTK